MAVEVLQSSDPGRWSTGHLQHAEDGPPRDGVIALLQVEAGQVQGLTLTLAQHDEVGKQLCNVQRTRLHAEAHGSRPQQVPLNCRTPLPHQPLAPDAVHQIQHGDGSLILRSIPAGGFGDHDHVRIKPWRWPLPMLLYQGQQAGDGVRPQAGQTPPHSDGDAQPPGSG